MYVDLLQMFQQDIQKVLQIRQGSSSLKNLLNKEQALKVHWLGKQSQLGILYMRFVSFDLSSTQVGKANACEILEDNMSQLDNQQKQPMQQKRQSFYPCSSCQRDNLRYQLSQMDMSFQVDNQRILSKQQSRLLLHINPKDKQQQLPLCKTYQLDIGKSLLLKVIQLYTSSHLNKCSCDNLQGLQFFSFQLEDSNMLNHTKCTKLIFQDQVRLRKFQSGMVKQLAVLCLIHRKIPRRSLLELLIQ